MKRFVPDGCHVLDAALRLVHVQVLDSVIVSNDGSLRWGDLAPGEFHPQVMPGQIGPLESEHVVWGLHVRRPEGDVSELGPAWFLSVKMTFLWSPSLRCASSLKAICI